MKIIAFLALLGVAFATNVIFETPHYERTQHRPVFKRWQKHFNKKYGSIEEEIHRFTVFLENWKMITETNKKNLGYELGLNQFADLNGEEFKLYVHGTKGSCLRGKEQPLHVLEKMHRARNVKVPTSVDWTTKGVVTPVKNQGQCGSCWAFSTTGSIESAYAIKTGQLNSLSEQQLVDCSRAEGNQGCQGGLMDNGFRYVKKEGGLCSEAEYPYTAKNGVCKASTCGTKYDPITGYTDVTKESSISLEEAVAKGPVSIAIEADQSSFQFYRRGVLTGNCGTRLDHGVLVVGYGSESGQDYWKVKNSWGATWGDAGYVMICRNCNKNGAQGECGILDQPSYPTV